MEFYKTLHLASIFFFLTGLAASLLGDSQSKLNKIITGIASLFILVGGMGLIKTSLGISHGDDVKWPGFIHAKITIWAILVIAGPVVNKRLGKGRALAFYGFMVLALVATSLAVYKPF